MRIKLRSKFMLLFMTFALLLAVPAVALADRLDADADTFATATPAANDMADIEQQLGTTKTYPFSAAVQNTGGDNNTVNAFRSPSTSFPNDKVTVTNNFSGAWVDQAGSGPASFEITAYNQNHQGNISIAVPCDAEIGTPATMTVELSAVASNTTANLNGATQTVNYTITPTGTPDENECTPADTTAPDPPSTPDLDAASDSGSSDTDNVTNDNKPDFSGTAEANSTVELFADATSLGTTTADASGNWSFDGDSILTSALADDTYSITAKATDASNNTSGASGALSVTIDTVANAPTGLDLTTDTGTSPTDDITNDKTPTIEGSAEANGSVELFEGTTSLGTGSANNSGAWSITSGTLTDGQHTLKAQVTDVAGNVSALSSGLVVTIDTVNPVVSFVNASAFSGNPSFDFGSVPPAPTCSATDTGGSGVDGTCQVGGYDTAVGNYTLTATANDIAGNEGAATPLTYSVLAAKAYGFYQPVDMGGTLNTVKSGSTVPVKFELFGGASNTEQKNLSAVSGISARKVDCGAFTGAPTDTIEYLAPTSEPTVLRFDTTGDQFIYNWKTPAKAANTCYNLTMTAADNTTKLVAYFQLK